jgi:hypothetical protein
VVPIRNVPAIWDTWRSGAYVGATRPSTRVTVEKGWSLQTTGTVVGNWTRGPARWYQRSDRIKQLETEIPNVLSVTSSRSIETDAGTCDIIIQNTVTPEYGQPETPVGQFGDIGHFTWDHGSSQDARARWGHVQNPWNEVLVPNALLRTYVGFGGQDLAIDEAVAQNKLVLYGVWLIDEISVGTEGTVNIKCRDMGKLLVDQQLFPPLVPGALYPLSYQRWKFVTTGIPGGPYPADQHWECQYWSSSTDVAYGEWNTGATGHRGTDAFDMSFEPNTNIPGVLAHQRTYWLSEPKGGPNETVWIEFFVNGGDIGLMNQIYFHPWKGNLEGRGCHRVMISIFENGYWAAPEAHFGSGAMTGGVTPEGIPYIHNFVPGTSTVPGGPGDLCTLPRAYNATLVRLTVTDLKWADDFPYGYQDPEYHGGGWRGGARKIYAHFDGHALGAGNLVAAVDYVRSLGADRRGYWQLRSDGQMFAFGDARTFPINSPRNVAAGPIVKMVAANNNQGYWYVDLTGRVFSAGSAHWFGDLDGQQFRDVMSMAVPTNGSGYYLLHSNGRVDAFGSATHYGNSTNPGHVATCITANPAGAGYWVLWTNGVVTAHGGAPHFGNVTTDNFAYGEWNDSLRPTSNGQGYWVLSTLGRMQVRGNAPFFGQATESLGADAAYRTPETWYFGVTWDFILSSQSDKGYAIVSADGKLWPHGEFTDYGSVGVGQARQRFEGNYKDYSDIVKELCLWSGFYLQDEAQPPDKAPAVYGNIETSGAYSETDLPVDMFDKKPVMEAIKQLKEIVGYSVWIDPEGGFRWESPNWWTLGNFLITGVPFPNMPEVDEAVQLVGHNITFSASAARSRLIIATQDPYPTIPGTNPPKGVVITEIVPKTAADLRGLLVPAMWTNGKFLKPEEQKVMADLVDMRMWFSRRRGSVDCVANPLLDINDQVRVIERQTGDVYIHYIRGINFSHDLQSGDFRMSLDTHWLGGSPWGKSSLFHAGASRPSADGYWLVTIGGSEANAKAGIYSHGQAAALDSKEADSHLEPIVGLRSTNSGDGYYTIDESGKVLTYGNAHNYGSIYRGMKNPNDQRPNSDVVDMALTPSGNGYWILQKNGTITALGDAVHQGNATPTGKLVSGADIYAIALESHPTTPGYWVLLTNGTVQAFGLATHGNANRTGFGDSDYVTRLRRTTSGAGYWIISAAGIVQAFGNATIRTQTYTPPVAGQWFYGLVWDILVAPDGSYALVRADGELVGYGYPIDRPASSPPRQANWALLAPEDYLALTDHTIAFPVSHEVMAFLAGSESPSGNNAVVNNFAAPSPDAIQGVP